MQLVPSPPQPLIEWVSLIADIVVALGVLGAPFALLSFLRERRKERLDRELSTFSTLSTTYIGYLRLCLDDPDLPCADVSPGLSETERKKEILLHIVVSMLEEAYFLYHEQDSALKEAQWQGWKAYMADWAGHPEFRRRWPGIIEQYDRGFALLMAAVYDQTSEGHEAHESEVAASQTDGAVEEIRVSDPAETAVSSKEDG